MVMTPVVLCLSKSGFKTARRIANILGAQLHGREGRVDGADATFENTLDYVRVLFAAGTPIVGVCAAGILVFVLLVYWCEGLLQCWWINSMSHLLCLCQMMDQL